MKFLHTADWHLGKALYGRSMMEEQTWFLQQWLLPLLECERPDALVVAGDIFDRQVPPVEAVVLFNAFLNQLAQLEIPLIAVTGNHDSAQRMSLGTALLRKQGVVLATKPEDLLNPYTISTKDGALCFYLLPFCDAATARETLHQEEDGPRTMDEAFRALLAQVKPNPAVKNILVTHCFAAGGQVGASESPAFVGGSSQVGLDCFAPFDYVALGHLHGAQKAGCGRYSGSPLKYSFDEAGQKKSAVMVTVNAEDVQTELLPIQPPHDVRVLTGKFEELLANAQMHPSDDYLLAKLTDACPIYQPVDRLSPYYPNLLGVSSEFLLFGGNEEDDSFRREMRQHRVSDEQVFSAFLKQVCGTEPTKEDLALFHKMMKEEEEA